MQIEALISELERFGRVLLRNVFTVHEMENLARLCNVGGRPGERIGFSPEFSRLIGRRSRFVNNLKSLRVDPEPVRLVAFNKTLTSNWGVPWHQDRVIAVAERANAPGYSNWVSKGAFWHCEPPLPLLERMVFIRINLDPFDECNGALELALGSHKHGLVPACDAAEIAVRSDTEIPIAEPGDVLVVKALTLHRSRSATKPSARRALRADYAVTKMLDARLKWAYSV